MTRTSFELEFPAKTASSAKVLAETMVADYLELPREQISDLVDLEFKVKYSVEDGVLVTVYGTVKRNIVNL
jgi:hypothetical protein